ncbi:uncharacterized protein LOC131948886 [Physella acuta]|uniref:uncharacterized protein LOC131948886 n=1 Tax=Physella acuta TaxID=109671 RepID=UPI0027DACB4D|nr:uncharacterized protein LOC131948886 [Physella acuta]
MFIFVFFIPVLFVAVHADCSGETANLPDAPVVTVDGKTVKNATIFTKSLGNNAFYDANITCSVAGGTSSVYRVGIICGTSLPVISTGQVVSSVFRIPKDFEERCVCNADHSSGCYDKATSVYFNLQYIPVTKPVVAIKNSILGDGIFILDSSSYSSAKVKCGVYDGNPAVSEIILVCQAANLLVPPSTQIEESFQGSFTVKGDQICTCSATHSTGLYDLKTTFGVKFQDLRPTVKVNGQEGTSFQAVTNKTASTVSVSCQSEFGGGVAVGCNISEGLAFRAKSSPATFLINTVTDGCAHCYCVSSPDVYRKFYINFVQDGQTPQACGHATLGAQVSFVLVILSTVVAFRQAYF